MEFLDKLILTSLLVFVVNLFAIKITDEEYELAMAVEAIVAAVCIVFTIVGILLKIWS